MPVLKGSKAPWAPRTLFFQWHRGERPNPFQNAAAHNGRYKLIDGKELYDLQTDPTEKTDIAGQNPDMVRKLRGEYEAWFADVSATRNYEPPKSWLGTANENPVTLTRQDWRGPHASWEAGGYGHWEVDVRTAGRYDITVRMPNVDRARPVTFELGSVRQQKKAPGGIREVTLTGVELPKGPGRLSATLDDNGKITGGHYVDVKRV